MDRCGDGISTQALLQFQLDHAHARDAVNTRVDFPALAVRVAARKPVLTVQSDAVDRATYIRRPDFGRRLNAASRARLLEYAKSPPWDLVFVIADGLSAVAVEHHAAPLLEVCLDRLADWRIAPVVLAAQGRVALGDEVCACLNADLCVVLIGERPGLSVADSLGAYLTWRPRVGHRDADRNCVSNIHASGLRYPQAAEKICWLLGEARRRQLSGVALKENATPTEFLAHDAASNASLLAKPDSSLLTTTLPGDTDTP
jgi:ethanolamine ammonia-lyase small subunit